jgi:hypothetical protein
MTTADTYRKMAAELRAKAANAPNERLAAEWNHLAQCYLRLSEQADSNSVQDVLGEFGPKDRIDGDEP